MSRHTLFDFNGVLVDDEPVHLEAFREVLGLPIRERDYQDKYFGFDDAGAIRAMLEDAGKTPTDDEVKRLVQAKKPIYMRRIAGGLRIFPGARAILERRAARGTVGIVSGALRDEIEHALAVMNARDLVHFVIAAEDCERCKPDPEGYLLGAKRAPNAVVIEDSVQGVIAAKAAGLRVAAVTHSYPAEKLAHADVVVGSLDELTNERLDG